MSDTCGAWARFPGMTEPVRCPGGDAHGSTLPSDHLVHRASFHASESDGRLALATYRWTDDAPGLETGYDAPDAGNSPPRPVGDRSSPADDQP